MTGIVDWAASRARMVLAFILLSLTAGWLVYTGLPKEGEPDIEIPALFVSVPFPGISAEDAETLLVEPMETELADLDGLDTMTSTAAEGFAAVAMEFEFGWDKSAIMADVRQRMNDAEAEFPEGAEQYSITEINFSEFPIVIVNLTGDLPERTLLRVATDLQDRLEALDPILEAGLAGHRDEMVEVVIDPLRLEAYNVTAGELINVVQNNNQLVAAGEVETDSGAFAVKIPSSFDEQRDIYELPVKTNGERVVTLGDLADIRLTFEDRAGTARYNGETTVALQIVKRKGFNLIDTAQLVRDEVAAEEASWSPELREAIEVGVSNDTSREVESMVAQLEGSVLTAVALVMIVVLAALGLRSAFLVGFAIPTSFLLCFILLGLMGISISNIVMFGLILAVGMLVDGAIVVTEYAERRIEEGAGPMTAFVEAAKRMFWPIVSSTATTLCAFAPMLFWPGVPGEFMGMLPVTLIFVLSASLVVALIYLPVMGGVAGRLGRSFDGIAFGLRATLPWLARLAIALVMAAILLTGALSMLNPTYLLGDNATSAIPGLVLLVLGASGFGIAVTSIKPEGRRRRVRSGYRRSVFGRFINMIVGNPVMPLVALAAVGFFFVSVFTYFGQNNNGVEFFVETEPERAIVYVRARGNFSLAEKDALLRQAEDIVLGTVGIQSAFSFAGDGGLNSNTGGTEGPLDAIGQVQIELIPWDERPAFAAANDGVEVADLDGNVVMDRLIANLAVLPGIRTEIVDVAQGPGQGKPVHLRLKGDDWADLNEAAAVARRTFDQTPGLVDTEDSRPLPGIDFEIDVDTERAGRFGADVAIVGAMVQLVTRGILLDTMRVDSSDEEIDIRVRLPEEDRVLSTLDSLKVRTSDGLVPLANFITRRPVPSLGQIDRIDQSRYFDVKADVLPGLSMLRLIPLDEEGDPVEGGSLDVGFGYELSEEEVAGGDPFNLRIEQERAFFFHDWLFGPRVSHYNVPDVASDVSLREVVQAVDGGDATVRLVPVNPNERIAVLTDWLDNSDPFPSGIEWEWTGDQEEQAESQAFLMTGFGAALALMFVILLAQFNSFYNAVLVLIAVILSVSGALIGMLVMGQAFSIIMTGTGIVALAGIVVNNNIVLIDTYQDYSRYMPRLEAITRTAEHRIRPVLLTTITTMAGLTPMMLGLSFDFIGGGYSVDSPTSLWWKQLATAVVFGLGVATVLTLVVTPSALALRVWLGTGAYASVRRLRALASSRTERDLALQRAARQVDSPEILWDTGDGADVPRPAPTLRAAE